jgi:DeoR/GlpR family transcriptional regulator of sugar metabolism
MLIEKRLEALLQAVTKNGTLSFDEAMRITECSRDTVRRDFIKLEEKKLVRRTRGGIVHIGSAIFSYDQGMAETSPGFRAVKYDDKETIKNFDAKNAIALRAVELIGDNEKVLLDSGSTTMLTARNIGPRIGLTILTNCIRVALELVGRSEFHTILLGGDLNTETLSVAGPDALGVIEHYHVDRMFMGTAAFSVDNGVMSPFRLESMLKKTMMQAADEIVLLADSSKANRNALYSYARMDEIDILVTDSGIEETTAESLRGLGIRVEIAEIPESNG